MVIEYVVIQLPDMVYLHEHLEFCFLVDEVVESVVEFQAIWSCHVTELSFVLSRLLSDKSSTRLLGIPDVCAAGNLFPSLLHCHSVKCQRVGLGTG